MLIVQGLKRSGNHAVINWLRAHDQTRFFNDIIPMNKVLAARAEVPPTQTFDSWLRRRVPMPIVRRLMLAGRSVIVSLEDRPLDEPPFTCLPADHTHVLILRDPANLFASRIRKASHSNKAAYASTKGPALDRAVDMWKAHAREFLGDTDDLGNRVGVYFPAWFTSVAYRRSLSRALGYTFTDAGFGKVSAKGGGSSFDGTAHDGNSAAMRVLDRAGQLSTSENQLLQHVLADAELRDLASRVECRINAELDIREHDAA